MQRVFVFPADSERNHISHIIFPSVFPFDPEAMQVGHFDSKLDTGDQSSAVMTLLPRAKQLVH